MKNIFTLPPSIAEEIIEILHETPLSVQGNPGVRIERILSAGQVSPEGFWYDQDENEWVLLAQGEAKVAFYDGALVSLKAGDHIFIEAHKRHRVEYTSVNPPCVWICVFYEARP
ncbi:MAG TPA: cupin domain-containing protein [Candidatus Wallbacteria bacterium]|nr:cupin domain-containing protein [Candidatus Wallbacteria bacterium]